MRRALRALARIGMVYLLLLVAMFVLALVFANGAEASPISASLVSPGVPWALLGAVLSGNVIPYLSAIATKAPTWATGAITFGLSVVSAFAGEAVNETDGFNWQAAILTAALTVGMAALHHSKILKGTQIEADLHAKVGNKPTTAAPPPPAT